MYSILIKNATVFDGKSPRGSVMDVAISGNEIVNVAPRINQKAHTTIQAAGKILTPGFIDIQNHSDSYWQIIENPGLDSLLLQGITTIIVGQCGASLAPLLSPSSLLALQKWHQLDGTNVDWQTFTEFARWAQKQNFGCNIGSLVGYSTLRRGLLGDETRSLNPDELQALKQALTDALTQGAFGLSSGLSYAHELPVAQEELTELAQITADHKGLLSVHLRNESDRILESLEEAVELCRNTGVKTKISHLKIQYEQNWRYFDALLERLETERHKGLPLVFDVYPYSSVWQVLLRYLPSWSQEGGMKKMAGKLADKAFRKKVRASMQERGYDYSKITVASTANNLNFSGKTISKIAKDLELSPEDAILTLVEQGGSGILVFDESLNPEHVKSLSKHPMGIFSTDGAGFSSISGPTSTFKDWLIHQRCFGATAKFLEILRKPDGLSLSEIISKLTFKPAELLGLEKRGHIKVGNYADLLILDEQKFSDQSTLDNPYKHPGGLEYVIVSGEIAVKDGEIINKKLGTFLRKN